MGKQISILILDNSFTFGGAINSLSHLLRAFDNERFAPVLVTGQAKEFLAENFACPWYQYVPKLPWVDNLVYRKIAALPLFRWRVAFRILNLLRFLYWIIFVNLPEAFKYYRLGRKHQVAIVHLNNIFGSQLAGILAAKLLRVPCVAHLRDFEEVHPITRFYASLIDHHVAISGAIKDNLLQLGVPAEKISVVHDGIDLDEFNVEVDCQPLLLEFGLTSNQLRFGIFGRVVKWKGVFEFLHAARRIIIEVPAARAFIVGGHSDGGEEFLSEMKQLVEELGLEGKVVFTGYRKDVPALMKFMDVVVHASIRPEPFGMVIIEGMAMGKPVVATRGGGPLDIVIDGRTGLLVEMGDSEELALAVCTLLQQPDLRRKIGLAGRARVEQAFSSRRYAEQMEEVFQRLLVRG